MDINGWLTIIAVFTALFALLPREELSILYHKVNRWEIWIIVSILIFIIPYLILFPQVSSRIPWLNTFTFSWGIRPANLAFILFFLSLLLCIYRLFVFKPNKKHTKELTNYFQELLNEKSFDEFFKLFTKYTTTKQIKDNWKDYKDIFFQKKFLNGIFNNRTKYLLQFWELFFNEDDFRNLFRLYLENEDSDYYSEIKDHWNSNILTAESPFLNILLKDHVKEAVKCDMVGILFDCVMKHLKQEHSKAKLYNQLPYYNRVRKEDGYDLPLYYHIRFYGFLHQSIIKNKIDTGGQMISFYSSMVEEMVRNMVTNQENKDKEYPSNYHWLIGEICDAIDIWASTFVQPSRYDPTSSYNGFITHAFWEVINTLLRAVLTHKVTQAFLNSRMHYGMLTSYFNPEVPSEFKNHIEVEILNKLDMHQMEPIFNFSLDERFATRFFNVKAGNFGVSSSDYPLVQRLNDFLKRTNRLNQ